MPAPKYSESKEQLIEDIRGTEGAGSRQYDIAKALLEAKNQEDIIKETKSLKFATWGLVFGTVGLVIATLALIFVTVNK